MKTKSQCIVEAFSRITDGCENGISTEGNLHTHLHIYLNVYFTYMFYLYIFKVHTVFDLAVLFH